MLYFSLKALHLAAVGLWFGALFLLFTQLSRLALLKRQQALGTATALRAAALRLWRDIASPAAAVAVLLGIVLMLKGHAAAWVATKLLAVAGLALLHVAAGTWLEHLHEHSDAGRLPPWIGGALASLLLMLFLLIAAVSGAKPDFSGLAGARVAAARDPRPAEPCVHRDLRECERSKRVEEPVRSSEILSGRLGQGEAGAFEGAW